MKYTFAILLALALAGCDGSTQTRPDGSTVPLDSTKSKYGRESFTLLCVNNVEYLLFYKKAITPKYNLDGTLVPCEQK